MVAVPIELESVKEKKLKKSGSKEKIQEEPTKPNFLQKCLQAVSERSRVLLFILVVVVFLCRITLIRQVQDSMKIAQVLLCDGNLSFIFVENPSTSVLEISYTEDLPKQEVLPLPVDDLGNIFDSVLQATELCEYFDDETKEYKSIIDRLGLCSKHNLSWCTTCENLLRDTSRRGKIREDIAETVAMTSQSDAQVRQNMACTNLFSSTNETEIYRPFEQLLRAANFSGEVKACAEMFEHCYHSDFEVREYVRLFCPRTCLCDAALQSTITPNQWYFNRVGCVPACASSISGSELANFEQELLITGESACYDRDSLEHPDVFLPYVEDVVDYLVSHELLVQHTDANGNVRHTPHAGDVVPVFSSYTQQDFRNFENNVLFNSVGMSGCSFTEGADTILNLTDWYYQSDGLCHWASIVSYAFNINLCAESLLEEGFTPIRGLCPLSCGLGVCGDVLSSAAQTAGLVGDSYASWYNVVGWGKEGKYNVRCDSSNFMCMKVVQFHSQHKNGWFDNMYLNIEMTPHGGGNSSLLYEGYGNAAIGAETLYLCTRRNDTHPPNFTISAWGWWLGLQSRRAVRWQIRDMNDNHLITAGWNRDYHIQGYNWRNYSGFQETCEQGGLATVMGSFNDMQVLSWYRNAYGLGGGGPYQSGPTGDLEFARRGMFTWQTVSILGGYNAVDDTVLVQNLNTPWNPQTQRVQLGELGVPQSADIRSFQDYKSCSVGSSLALEAATAVIQGLCGNTLTCTDAVQRLSCESTAPMVEYAAKALGACDSPTWDGTLNQTTKLHELCPQQCQSQADQSKCPQSLMYLQNYVGGPGGSRIYGSNYYWAYYYNFQEPMCMPSTCQCLTPQDIIHQCSAEFFSLENPLGNWRYQFFDHVSGRYAYGVHYRESLENATRLLTRNTSCFWANEGWHEREPIAYDGPWCLVDAYSCDPGSFMYMDFGTDYSRNLYSACGWRPAYEDYECKIDYRDYNGDFFAQQYFFVISETTTLNNSYGYGGGGYGGPYGGGPYGGGPYGGGPYGGGGYGGPYGGYYGGGYYGGGGFGRLLDENTES